MNRKKILSAAFVLMFLLVSFRISAEESKNTPVPVSPGSDTEVVSVWQSCPTFSWSAVDQASSYRIAVFEVVDSEVTTYEDVSAMTSPVIIKDIPGPALSWTLPAEENLKTGDMYSWYVQAIDVYGNALGNWSNGNIFKVEQEVRFAGIEEKLAQKLRDYGVNEETISNVLKDVSSEVKEVVVRNEGSVASVQSTPKMNEIKGTEGPNTYYGLNAGASNTTGWGNTFLGFSSGYKNVGGCGNNFIGNNAGYSNLSGSNNTFIGQKAGYSNTTANGNIFIGEQAGYFNTTGIDNIFIGLPAGYNNTTGNANIFLGEFAGFTNTTGSYNLFLGNNAGHANTTGGWNTFIGNGAGRSNAIGNHNVFLGTNAGYLNTLGLGNVCLGFNAGYTETGSNRLYIANSDTGSPLIYGEFDNGIVSINGRLGVGTKTPSGSIDVKKTSANAVFIIERTDGAQGKFAALSSKVSIGSRSNHNLIMVANNNAVMTLTPGGYVGVGTSTPSYPLQMASGAYCSTGGTWFNASSRSLKENIRDLSTVEAVKALSKLNPVKYNYKVDKTDKHVGFIAEDVPELVAAADRKGLSAMDVTAVLTKVVQEQQKIISGLQERLAKIEKER